MYSVFMLGCVFWLFTFFFAPAIIASALGITIEAATISYAIFGMVLNGTTYCILLKDCMKVERSNERIVKNWEAKKLFEFISKSMDI